MSPTPLAIVVGKVVPVPCGSSLCYVGNTVRQLLCLGVTAIAACLARRPTQCINRKVLMRKAAAFEVRNVQGGKGLGVIATRKIFRGEFLFREQPFITFDETAIDEVADEDSEHILRALAKHPEEEQKRFWGLADSCRSPGASKSARGIARTNGFPHWNDDSQGCLYLTISRFNHSCNPNVQNTWQEEEGAEVLYANQDIELGRELSISYLSYSELCAPREQRRERLRRKFRFDCFCDTCSLSGELLEKSDERRARLHELDQAFSSDESVSNEVAGLLDEELSGNPAGKCRAYFKDFQAVIDSGNLDLAASLAEKAWENSVAAEGLSSSRSLALGACMLQLKESEEI